MYSSSDKDNGLNWLDDLLKGAEEEEEHVKAARRIGIATLEKPGKKDQDDLHNNHGKKETIIKPGTGLLVFGVFLPLMAMFFEHSSHTMARAFFDPFPTFNHYLLFSLIPVSNFLTWLSARANIQAVYSITALTSGMSLGIAILYSLMLLPMTPLFLFALPVGILGLAPLASIPYILRAGKTICQLAGRHDTFFDAHQFKHLGHVIILVMVICVELPSTLTRMHLSDAAKPDQKVSADAIDWLRTWGSKEVLLRACYERSGRATDLIGSLYEHQHPVSIETARRIYYRVTGIPFNAVPIPASFRSTIQHNGLINDPDRLNAGAVDEFDLDPDIAGEMVQGVARGLSVDDSTIAGTIDANSRVAALNWTFNFTNISKVPREARAKILLPEGAVVSRATMWIDGEEKEAKIMGRARARATYVRAVHTHKRDPLLVSMQGKDTVLVQCYPVLKGSDTRVRLHIAAPLKSVDKDHAELSMPSFAERNFGFGKPHKLALESDQKFTISNTSFASQESEKVHQSLEAELDNKLFSRHEARVIARVNPTIKLAHFELPATPVDIPMRKYPEPQQLSILVDKSIGMEPYISQIEEGIRALGAKNKDIFFRIYSLDDGSSFESLNFLAGDNLEEQLKLMRERPCKGGIMNDKELTRLLNMPSASNRRDILWIHASQPVVDPSSKTFIDRRFKYLRANLYDLQVASGPNALFDKASMEKNFIRVAPGTDLKTTIANLDQRWSSVQKSESESPAQAASPEQTAKSRLPEFDMLRAYQKVLDKYYQGDPYGASALAVANHLITPVTSAVVTDDKLIEKYELKKAREIKSYRPDSRRKISYLSTNPLFGLGDMVSRQIEQSTDRLSSLSDAASMAPGGLGERSYQGSIGSLRGAPVDPRYGQSNEVGRLEAKKAFPASEPARMSDSKSRKRDLEARMSKSKQAFEYDDSIVAAKEEAFKADKDASESIVNGPVLQGATNGKIGQISNGNDYAVVDEMVETEGFAGEEQSVVKAKNKGIFQTLKAKVVPEPDTTPMLLIALMVLAFGLILVLKQGKEKPADNR